MIQILSKCPSVCGGLMRNRGVDWGGAFAHLTKDIHDIMIFSSILRHFRKCAKCPNVQPSRHVDTMPPHTEGHLDI